MKEEKEHCNKLLLYWFHPGQLAVGRATWNVRMSSEVRKPEIQNEEARDIRTLKG